MNARNFTLMPTAAEIYLVRDSRGERNSRGQRDVFFHAADPAINAGGNKCSNKC